MSSVVETLDGLKRKIKITIPGEEVSKAYEARLKEVAKNADIKGFRPGKVPAHVIEQKFGSGICQEIAGMLMEKFFQTAIEENNLRIAGSPEVHSHELKKDQPYEFEATFEIYPDIELHDLEGEQLEKLIADIADEDVNKMLENISKHHANWEAVERPAALGDKVTIDFEGFIDDKPFEGGKAENFQLELGLKQMIPGFEEGIAGAKPNDSLELKVAFPSEYPVQDLAGKDAVFKVTVHKVEEGKLPPVDDDLAKKVGIDGGVAELREEAKKNMQKELERVTESKLKNDVLERLLAKNTVLLPEALIDAEIKHLQQMTLQQMSVSQGYRDIPDVDLPREPFIQEAHKRVSLGLLLAEVIKLYNIELDSDKVRQKVEEIASNYDKSDEVVAWYYKNKKLLSEVEAAVLEEQVVDHLLEKVNITEKASTYDEIMQTASKEG